MTNHDDFVDEFIEYQIFEDSMKNSGGGNSRKSKKGSGCFGCGTSTIIVTIALVVAFVFGACSSFETNSDVEIETTYAAVVENTTIPINTTIASATEIPSSVEPSVVVPTTTQTVSLADIPAYSEDAYIEINGNAPFFSTNEYTTSSFEQYSDLDSLGRCGVAYTCIGTDIMPTEERGAIGMVKPSGWHTVRYDDVISDKYLYNRCHLIAFELAGENANEKNLITGTRYMNIQGMLPFENNVHDYVEQTDNHVLYRSTPIFESNNLVANGVLLEGYSVEDSGAGISFCVYCYNVQPGIEIDYNTGDSRLADETTAKPSEHRNEKSEIDNNDSNNSDVTGTYVLNTNTKKFHYPNCSSVSDMKEKNKKEYTGSRDDVIAMGYEPCKRCNP